MLIMMIVVCEFADFLNLIQWLNPIFCLAYPNIKVDPETVTIKEGESIVIKCESTASPIPK